MRTVRRLALTVAAFAAFSGSSHASAQETDTQLGLALVIHVTTTPLVEPTGTAVSDADERLTSIARTLSGLEAPELDELPFAIAPSAVFCDELSALATAEARQVQTIIRRLATRVDILSTPYSEIRLGQAPEATPIGPQITAGRRAIEKCVRARPRQVLLPPDLSLDEDALAQLRATSVRTVLAPRASVGSVPVREDRFVLVPADVVKGGDAPNDVVVRFGLRQQAAAILPADAGDIAGLIRGLANDPRVSLVDVAGLIADPPQRTVFFQSEASPPSSYERALARARDARERFGSYTLDGNHLGAVLRTAYARALGSAEWDARWSVGRRRAAAIVRAVETQEDLVTTTGGAVTFTSRRGSVPVTVTNRASYPVRVRVTVASPKLDFPEGSARVVTVDPPGDTVVFTALTRSTGTFPMSVRVTSIDRVIRFDGAELTVRSAAANVSSVVLTAGGALFLAAWSLRRVRRRRSAREEQT